MGPHLRSNFRGDNLRRNGEKLEIKALGILEGCLKLRVWVEILRTLGGCFGVILGEFRNTAGEDEWGYLWGPRGPRCGQIGACPNTPCVSFSL